MPGPEVIEERTFRQPGPVHTLVDAQPAQPAQPDGLASCTPALHAVLIPEELAALRPSDLGDGLPDSVFVAGTEVASL